MHTCITKPIQGLILHGKITTVVLFKLPASSQQKEHLAVYTEEGKK